MVLKNTSFIDGSRKRGFKFISNDEELLLTYDHEERISWRIDSTNIYKLDRFLSVGDLDDKILKKKFPDLSTKIIKCGNIRLELLKKPYLSILQKKTANIKKILEISHCY